MRLYLSLADKAKDASNNNESNKVDVYLSLLTTINNRIEDILGSGSKGLIFSTGVDEGKRIGEGFPKACMKRIFFRVCLLVSFYSSQPSNQTAS